MKSKIQVTADQSKTLYNPVYNQAYHSSIGANIEALEKFIHPSRIAEYPSPVLLDIGFGLGYNAFHAFKSCQKIEIISLEKDKAIFQYFSSIHKDTLWEEYAIKVAQHYSYREPQKLLTVLLGDARLLVQSLLTPEKRFSHIFLDAFSPSVNAELWTVDFLHHLFLVLKDDGCIVTYSSALPVLNALIRCGFWVYFTPSVGRKRGGLIAYKNKSSMSDIIEITPRDHFLLKYSVQSIPNRDKGNWSHQEIYQYRENLKLLACRLGFKIPNKRALKLWERKQ